MGDKQKESKSTFTSYINVTHSTGAGELQNKTGVKVCETSEITKLTDDIRKHEKEKCDLEAKMNDMTKIHCQEIEGWKQSMDQQKKGHEKEIASLQKSLNEEESKRKNIEKDLNIARSELENVKRKAPSVESPTNKPETTSHKEKEEMRKNVDYLEQELAKANVARDKAHQGTGRNQKTGLPPITPRKTLLQNNQDKPGIDTGGQELGSQVEKRKQDGKYHDSHLHDSKQNTRFEEENRELVNETQILKKYIDDLRHEITNERRAKEEAMTRWSEMAGTRICENNPDITDLSDTNRPMKIADYFSELYNNEWTNTFEKLTESGKTEEKAAIQKLLNILQDAYTFCENKAVEQRHSIEQSMFLSLQAHNQSYKPTTQIVDNLPDDIIRASKQLQKCAASLSIPYLQKLYLSQGACHATHQDVTMRAYTEKCVELCWLMVIQDPPLVMLSEVKELRFDRNMWKEYTTSGQIVEFIVWPALLLHHGPVLAKGVVQPVKEDRVKPAT